MAQKIHSQTRRDRWADWAVVGVLAVALLLGWAVMAAAQGQRETYTDAGSNVTVRYPQGWLLKQSDELAFQAIDPDSGDFKTTLELRVVPIEPSGAVTPTLTMVLNNASLSRAQQGSAYRLLEVAEGRPVDGRPAMVADYVYVHEGLDLFVQQIPVVVHGRDVALLRGDKAYVFSLLAAQDALAQAERELDRLVSSAGLGQ